MTGPIARSSNLGDRNGLTQEGGGGARPPGCRLVVMRHWRPELDDVVHTLRDTTSMQAVTPARAWLGTLGGRSAGRAVLVGDPGRPKRLNPVSPDAVARHHGGSGGQVFRIWWNGADEIRDFLRSAPPSGRPGETHICFFPDVVSSFGTVELDLLWVPYAFSRPRPEPSSECLPGICFTAEVDISDACFQAACSAADGSRLSRSTWDMARDVTGGRLTLVAADDLLAAESARATGGGPASPGYRAGLWALRNRVRYLLVKELHSAFPGQLVLRGSDWVRLGLPARTTSRRRTFNRARRMSDYARYRVSLDLGSKSTHAMLYPRSADIMAASGGIVQFDSGATPTRSLPTLESRQARCAADLIQVVERVLSGDGSEVAEENASIHQEYCAMRFEVGQRLAREIGSRCR